MGIRFVMRLKGNAVYELLGCESSSLIMFDGSFTTSQEFVSGRIMLGGILLRVVWFNGFAYLTNLMDVPAWFVVRVYEERWRVEVLFRRLKSYFGIDHLFSRSVNGFLVQVFVTLIVYLLVLLFMLECPYVLFVSEALRLSRYDGVVSTCAPG